MNLQDVKQLLIEEKFNETIEVTYNEQDVFDVFNKSLRFYSIYDYFKNNYVYDKISMKRLIVFLICIYNEIKLKKEHLPPHQFIDDFIRDKFDGKNQRLQSYQFIDDYLMRLTKIDNDSQINAIVVVKFIKKYPMEDECIEYLLDNSDVGILYVSNIVVFGNNSLDVYYLQLSDVLHNDTILEGLIKRDKLKVDDEYFKSLLHYCLFANLQHILDVILKYESNIEADKLDSSVFTHQTYSNMMAKRWSAHFDAANFPSKSNLTVESLEKISHLEGFDDFLRNNYDLIIEHCNEEVVNYVKSYV